MEEFANTIREQAAAALRMIYRQEAPRGADPVLELMGFLLDDGAGGIQSPPDAVVTTEQWLTWNRLALSHQLALVRTMTRELETERTILPTEMDAMRTWAARLLLNTLDRLGMV